VLLEAGPDWRSAEAPAQVRSMNGWRALDEAACGQFQWAGLESRRSSAQEPRAHVRGRGLGGSSVVNGMIAIHAMADDYERWAAGGCPGWSFEDILPYRRRLESDLNFGDRPYHGAGGPIPVQRLARDEWGPADAALAESAAAAGHGWCEDHNAPSGTGISPYGISARDGARVTTNDGYLGCSSTWHWWADRRCPMRSPPSSPRAFVRKRAAAGFGWRPSRAPTTWRTLTPTPAPTVSAASLS
jgi:choline dehydrogenase/5-(hydroxymethyl)furfural/furfural oxidase